MLRARRSFSTFELPPTDRRHRSRARENSDFRTVCASSKSPRGVDFEQPELIPDEFRANSGSLNDRTRRLCCLARARERATRQRRSWVLHSHELRCIRPQRDALGSGRFAVTGSRRRSKSRREQRCREPPQATFPTRFHILETTQETKFIRHRLSAFRVMRESWENYGR